MYNIDMIFNGRLIARKQCDDFSGAVAMRYEMATDVLTAGYTQTVDGGKSMLVPTILRTGMDNIWIEIRYSEETK